MGKVRSPVRAPEQYQSKGKRGSPQRKSLTSSISRPESKKENVKRTSDEEDPKSRKRSKGSSTASVTNDRTGNDDRPKFKIPLKPVQDRSIKQSNGFGRQISAAPVKDRASDRDRDWCRRDDRRRPFTSSHQYSAWSRSSGSSSRESSSPFRLDHLTEEQRQWLRQMPTSWRR